MYALRAKVKSVCLGSSTARGNSLCATVFCAACTLTRGYCTASRLYAPHMHIHSSRRVADTPLSPNPPTDSGSHRFLIDHDIHDNPVKGCGHPIRVFPRYVHFPANPHWNWGSLQTPPSPCQQTFHLRPFLCDPVGMCQGTCPRVKR